MANDESELALKQFAQLTASLPTYLEALKACKPMSPISLKDVPYDSGVYAFEEDSKYLYVGRTQDNLKQRLRQHARGTYKQSPLVFRLAMATARQNGVIIPAHLSREEKATRLDRFWIEAQERVRRMVVRFVKITDAKHQAVFEVYAAMVLATPYNSFSTS